MSIQPLCDLLPGQCAVIERVTASEPLRARLGQLGFLPGERVCRSFGDAYAFLAAYTVEGACIALRRPDAATVLVRL